MVRALRFVVLGGLFLVGSVLFTLVFGITDVLLLLQVLLMGVTGILFVVGGVGYDLGSIEWYQLVGVGDVLLGLSLGIPFFTALEGSGSLGGDVLFIGAAAIGGLSLAYMGIDWIRGGKHFDLSQFDSST